MTEHSIYVPEGSKRKWAHIYEPRILPHYLPYGAGQARYGITVDPGVIKDVEIIRAMKIEFDRSSGEAFVELRSKVRPEVHPLNKGVDDLVKEIARHDACNIPRDDIFRDRALVVYLNLVNWKHADRQGTMLVPTRIDVQL